MQPAFHNLQKYAYADDLAISYSSGDWNLLERTLREDITTLSVELGGKAW